MLISPWLPPAVDHTLFDHTSVLRYLCDKFGVDALCKRDAVANSLAPLLTRLDVTAARLPLLRRVCDRLPINTRRLCVCWVRAVGAAGGLSASPRRALPVVGHSRGQGSFSGRIDGRHRRRLGVYSQAATSEFDVAAGRRRYRRRCHRCAHSAAASRFPQVMCSSLLQNSGFLSLTACSPAAAFMKRPSVTVRTGAAALAATTTLKHTGRDTHAPSTYVRIVACPPACRSRWLVLSLLPLLSLHRRIVLPKRVVQPDSPDSLRAAWRFAHCLVLHFGGRWHRARAVLTALDHSVFSRSLRSAFTARSVVLLCLQPSALTVVFVTWNGQASKLRAMRSWCESLRKM